MFEKNGRRTQSWEGSMEAGLEQQKIKRVRKKRKNGNKPEKEGKGNWVLYRKDGAATKKEKDGSITST